MQKDIRLRLTKGVLNRIPAILFIMLLMPLTVWGDELSDSVTIDFLHEEVVPVEEPNDSVLFVKVATELEPAMPTPEDNRNWWYLFKKGKLSMQDPTVEWPKFLKFCVDVYNWGDHTFNSYNPEYVEGTGHRWKARLVSDNWFDSYAMQFKKSDLNMRMLGNLYSNLGAYLHYMAVSVGYSMNLNSIFGGKPNDHSRFETNFNCALFNFDLSYTKNSGGTYIRKWDGFNDNKLFKSPFPGVEMSTLNVSLYYFLNNKKYSQGAAYNFSKYQKRSAGSWLFGFSYNNLDITMDFTTLSPELKPLYPLNTYFFKFHYHSYCALFGYGYNWVWHPKWLFNVTVMPSVGFNRCSEDATDARSTLLALNIHGRASLTYNHRALFTSLIAKVTGNWYTSSSYSLFNAIEYFSLNVGFRF